MDNMYKIEGINEKVLVAISGNKYKIIAIDQEYCVAIDLKENKFMTGWCGKIDEDEDNMKYIEFYDKKHYFNPWRKTKYGIEYYLSNKTGYVYTFYKLGNTDKMCCMLEASCESQLLEEGYCGDEIEKIIGWEFCNELDGIPYVDMEGMIKEYEEKEEK